MYRTSARDVCRRSLWAASVGLLIATSFFACGEPEPGAESADETEFQESALQSGNGSTGVYFDTENFTTQRLTRVDPTINFDWKNGSPASNIGADTFSVRWTGFVVPRFSGVYTFAASSDDGVRLFVNGQRIIDAMFQRPVTEYTGQISLTAGQPYEIKLEYFEGSGGATIQLRWSSNQQAKEIIPTAALYTSRPVAVADAGSPGPTQDAGTAPRDAGTPPRDAGTPGTVDAGTPPTGGGTGTGKMFVSAYYAGWFPEQYPADKIDFSAMTHLFVGRASVGAGGTVTQALDANASNGVVRARDLADRAHAAGKKAVLMLGGVGEGTNFASSSNSANRANFVRNILAFVDNTRMDGVDLDWEENINHSDWLALVRDLKAARPGLIVTLPVFPVNINTGLTAAERSFFAAVHPLVDQISVMSYGIGMAGPWPGWVTWHTGALHGEASTRPTSIASTLAAYAAAGVPKAKLGMGIGFGGINFGPPNTAPLQSISGTYQADDIEWRYSRIVPYLTARPGNYQWDATAQMGYLSFPGGFSPGAGYSTAGFLSYEDERSIAAKGAWAKANGYGGTILWVINYGCTNPATGANPLLSAVKQAFLQ